MRIAVITGASSGIGREFVFSVDKEYDLDEIWVIARRADRLEELKDKCKNIIRPVSLDLAADGAAGEYGAMLEKEKPEVVLLINAAGCGVFGPFAEKDLDKLKNSATLNSIALTEMCHITLPYMSKGSNIINMGSNSAWQPVPYQAVYGASKAYKSLSSFLLLQFLSYTVPSEYGGFIETLNPKSLQYFAFHKQCILFG